MKETIGMYKGKFISQMTREELLDFASWAGKEIERLQVIKRNAQIEKDWAVHDATSKVH